MILRRIGRAASTLKPSYSFVAESISCCVDCARAAPGAATSSAATRNALVAGALMLPARQGDGRNREVLILDQCDRDRLIVAPEAGELQLDRAGRHLRPEPAMADDIVPDLDRSVDRSDDPGYPC